jgi:hypothetical protein
VSGGEYVEEGDQEGSMVISEKYQETPLENLYLSNGVNLKRKVQVVR